MGGYVCGYACSMIVCVCVCVCVCVVVHVCFGNMHVSEYKTNLYGGTDGQLQINSCGYTIS